MIKVINEENIGSEVKKQALMVMANLAYDPTNKPKMFSESLLKVSWNRICKKAKERLLNEFKSERKTIKRINFFFFLLGID